MSTHHLSLIVACDEGGLIGRCGALPWRLPADLRHFRRITMGKPVLMGRRTWDSIGRALPGRENIVISRNPGFVAQGAAVVHSFDAGYALALEHMHHAGADEVMVIGGGVVYAEALPAADRLYLTRVHTRSDGDTYLPAIDWAQWSEVSRESWPADAQNEFAMTFLRFDRCAS